MLLRQMLPSLQEVQRSSTAHALASLPQADDELSPAVKTVGKTMTILFKVADSVFETFGVDPVVFCVPSVEQERAPSHCCWPGCACCRTDRRQFEWVKEGEKGTQLSV